MNKESRIFIAGHRGLVGSAIVRELEKEGYKNLILKTHKELDLTNQQEVKDFFLNEKPEFVFLAAAKVGGIMANKTHPVEFINSNILIQTNVINNAYINNVKRLLFLGSSCIYPRLSMQPIKEEYLLSGELEPTNKAYAVAKIAGIILCQSYNEEYGTKYISLMPTNLYGQNDNFDLESSHVLPALIRKFHEAKINNSPNVKLWGTGMAKREFLHVDDFAQASVFMMNNYEDSAIINIGTGIDITIKDLAEKIKKIVNYDGDIVWDSTKPDGTPRKLLDVSRAHRFGWTHRIKLEDGIEQTYKWFRENC